MKSPKILACGPWMKERGMLPRRIVLRVFYHDDGRVAQFVVHTQGYLGVADQGRCGGTCYSSGHYFIPETTAGSNVMAAYDKALACWLARVEEAGTANDFEAIFGTEVEEVRDAMKGK